MSPPSLRIAYLVQQFVPEVGAGPARVLEMGRRWVEQGVELTVITGMPNRPHGRIYPEYRGRWFIEEQVEGIRVLRSWLYADPRHGFGRTILNNATFMVTSGLHALFRGGRPDVLIASAPPFFPHLTGTVLGALKRIPVVLEARDLWPDYLVDMGVLRQGSLSARTLFRMESWTLRRAAAAVVVTDSFRERLIAKGVTPARVHVLPNGVDGMFYRPDREPPPLDALSRRNGEAIVGYLGNFGAGQGLRTVLEAARIASREVPGVRFVLAGDGPDRARLEETVADLRLQNLSLHPPVPKEQTRAFYNACDICLVLLAPVPIFSETVPSKLFEILACGRPVLASVEGEARRIVESSGGGIVTAPGDPGGLVRGITQLLRLDRELIAEMGRRGREYALAHFERSRLADKYLEVLRTIVA